MNIISPPPRFISSTRPTNMASPGRGIFITNEGGGLNYNYVDQFKCFAIKYHPQYLIHTPLEHHPPPELYYYQFDCYLHAQYH